MSPDDRRTRLTTIWFADIAGFTRLSATDEKLALRVMDVMRQCVKASVGAQRGTVVKFLGDGALAEFPSAEGAVMAALEAAVRFEAGTRGHAGGPYQLHTGIHVGDVTASGDGDIFGDGVNRAQRVESLGKPGQTLVSDEVWRLVRRNPALAFKSLGQQTAKGLDEPFEVYLVEATGELKARLAQIEQGTAATAKPAVRVGTYSRTIGVGIAVGVATFGGLAVWTALGGRVETVPPTPIPDTIQMPAHDSALAMPVWPARSARDAMRTAAPSSLVEVASAGEQFFTGLGQRDLSTHEVLPLLRRSLNEARDGAPKGARADAIRGVALFMVARDAVASERAFRSAIAAQPEVGITRVMYAQLLTALGRFDEAKSQLDQARGKEVGNAVLDAARGGMLFRQGDYGDAKGALERSLKAEDLLASRVLLARTQIQQNKFDDAVKTLNQRIGSPEVVPWMAYARLRDQQRNNRGGAPPAGRPQLLQMARRPDAGYAGALILLAAGEQVQALDALARLARRQDPDIVWLSVDPEWASLRSNPRFKALAAGALGRR